VSYDLRLFSIPVGVEPEAAYEQIIHEEESETADFNDRVKRPLPDSTRAAMQQLAEAVRTRWPAFVQFQPASPLPWIELNDEDLQIQFAIYERTASITMAYFREPTARLMECIRFCLSVCQDECGYVAYDPQLGRVVGIGDVERIAEQYRGVGKVLPGLRGDGQKTKAWWRFW
jgi:hypothetical protein